MSLPRPVFEPETPATPRKRHREPFSFDLINPKVKRQLFRGWGLPRPVLNVMTNVQPTVAVRCKTPAQRTRRLFRARAHRGGHVRRSLNIQ